MTRPDAPASPSGAVSRRLRGLTRLSDSTMTVVFVALTGTAAVLSLALGVREARDRPPVSFGEEQVEHGGDATRVRVNVKNRTDEPLCPEIRIAARDREGLDLEEVVARPRSGSPAIGPDRSELYLGVFEELTDEQLEEELDELTAYLLDAGRECDGAATEGVSGG